MRFLSEGVRNLRLSEQTLAAVEKDARVQAAEHEGEPGSFSYSLQLLINRSHVGIGVTPIPQEEPEFTELVACIFEKPTDIGPRLTARKGDCTICLRSEWNEDENPLG